jgi:hypothetical protein
VLFAKNHRGPGRKARRSISCGYEMLRYDLLILIVQAHKPLNLMD